MQNNELEIGLIEKSILIMKGVRSVGEINEILGIDDSTCRKWLELAKDDIEPYKSYAQELELFEGNNLFNYDKLVENDFKSFKDNELDFLLEDNYLFSLDNTREDKINILKTRVHPLSLRDSIENLNNETSKLDKVLYLLLQLDKNTLISLSDDEIHENESKEEIAEEIISDIHIKNIDKLIMNLESYLSDLNDFNVSAEAADKSSIAFDSDNTSTGSDSNISTGFYDNISDISEPLDNENDSFDDEKSVNDNFETFVDGMMDSFLIALKEGKSEEEAMDISGLNSITLMSWKLMAENGDENFKKFYDEYMSLTDNEDI